jgi:uncharacterized protein (TIGR02284 family)
MALDPTAESLDEVASALNQLIQICKDGERGFQAAASEVKDTNLQRLFESYAQQRAEFAAELQLEVRRLARDPVDSGHATAAVHRGWMDLKAGITGRDDAAVISEAERGEDLAMGAYRKALNTDLPSDVRVLVERQFVQVKEAHDHVRSLEQAHARSE